MSGKLQIAVAGCGYWGPNLIRNFMALPDTNVRKICDLDNKRLAHMSSLYPGVETTNDFKDVIEDPSIDAVAIATPVRFHYEMARQSLLAGKHTFIEKPMASSTAQCDDLIAISAEKGLRLMVGHTFIYTSAVRKIRDIIQSGELGELFYIHSQRLNLGLFQKDINVAWDLAPHDITIILYVMNQEAVAVNCQGRANITPGIDDVTNMTVQFDKGGFATIQNSWLDPNKIRKMTFVCSKKMLVYDDTQSLEKIKIYDKWVEKPPYYDSFGDFQYSYHYGDMYAPYLKQVEPLKVECQHFIDCITLDSSCESSGEEGRRVVQILEASSRSLKEGGGQVFIEDSLRPTLQRDAEAVAG